MLRSIHDQKFYTFKANLLKLTPYGIKEETPVTELSGGLGFVLLALSAFLPSVFFLFLKKWGSRGGGAGPPLDPPLYSLNDLRSNHYVIMLLFIAIFKGVQLQN